MNHLLPAIFLFLLLFSCGSTESKETETSITTAEVTLPVERSTQPIEKVYDDVALTEKDLASTEVQTKDIAAGQESSASTEVQKTESQKQPTKPVNKTVPTSAKSKQTKVITESVERDAPRTDANIPQTREMPTPVEVKEIVTKKEAVVPARPDHTAWNSLLSNYVSGSGKVNYSGFKGAEGELDAYLAEVAKATPSSEWGRKEAMAYWMNTYNAFTVKLILKNWPVKSIMDLHGGKPWDVKWIKLAGKTYSLNQIEHDILRPTYKDPRIHFAVNCAAQSCPPIHNRAFTAANLNSKLESLAKSFINNPKYNEISSTETQVSSIFDWYGEDFGEVKTYLNKYSTTTINADTAINFKEYDWALNGK